MCIFFCELALSFLSHCASPLTSLTSLQRATRHELVQSTTASPKPLSYTQRSSPLRTTPSPLMIKFNTHFLARFVVGPLHVKPVALQKQYGGGMGELQDDHSLFHKLVSREEDI